MTEHEMRKKVRAEFPHLKIRIRSVGFSDLARGSAKCLDIEGSMKREEHQQINEWARQAGVLPDTGIRFYV